MKPPSTPPVSAPRSSDPPRIDEMSANGFETRSLSVDEFLSELKTKEQREILRTYLDSGVDSGIFLRGAYGNQIDWIVYKVNELRETYNVSFETVKHLLLVRLDEDFSDSDTVITNEIDDGKALLSLVREDIAQIECRESDVLPFADTVMVKPSAISSDNETDSAVAEAVQELRSNEGASEWNGSPWVENKGSKDDINVYVARLSSEKKDALPDYLKVNRNNRDEVTELANRHGRYGLELDFELTQMAERLGCTIEEVREAVRTVKKGGYVVTDNLRKKKVLINVAVDPRQQKTILSERIKKGEPDMVPQRGLLTRLFSRRKA